MIRIRLTYEQIEAAKLHLLTRSVLGCSLALILLDNVAEILMHRELETRFAFDDHLTPKWEPARTEWLNLGHGPKYSLAERRDAQEYSIYAIPARSRSIWLDASRRPKKFSNELRASRPT